MVEKDEPDALVIAEAMADSPAAADAVLAACRIWFTDEAGRAEHPMKRVLVSSPPESPVAVAAMYQSAERVHRYQQCGSSMACVLSVVRLLEALKPELEERLQAAGWPFQGTLELQTDLGDATLAVSPEGIDVESEATGMGGRGNVLRVWLPQTALARMALGAFPPEDLLARLPEPPEEKVRQLLAVLFPLRHPHMWLPDRF
jgi:hypothetical protein